MSLFSRFSRARRRAQAQKVLRKAVVETLESRRLLSITNFSFTGDSTVQEGHQAHFVLTADTDHDFTNPQLQVHIDFGVKDSNGIEETMDFSITPGQTNDIYGTFHEETNPSNPAHVTCSVHDDGAFTYNIGPDDRMGDLYVGVDDADLIGTPITFETVETPDLDGNTVLASDTTVGTFVDTAGADSEIGDFVASIDWGDGTTSSGRVVLNPAPNSYSVIGNHAYDSSLPSPDPVYGDWPVNVTVTDMAPNGGGGSEGGKSVTLASKARVQRGRYLNFVDPNVTKTDANGKTAKVTSITIPYSATTFTIVVHEENSALQDTPIGTTSYKIKAIAPATPAVSVTAAAPVKTGTNYTQKLTLSIGGAVQSGDTYTLTGSDADSLAGGSVTIIFK